MSGLIKSAFGFAFGAKKSAGFGYAVPIAVTPVVSPPPAGTNYAPLLLLLLEDA